MLVTDRERLRADIEAWTGGFDRDRSALLPVLREIHGKYGKVSEHAMQVVADLLDIHPV